MLPQSGLGGLGMAEVFAGGAVRERLDVVLGRGLTVLVFLFALAALLLFGASALGLIPWLSLAASFGPTPLPQAGVWVQGGLAFLGLILVFYLPAHGRVLALERSHRNFRINSDDVAQAYRAVHAADRQGIFALSAEFDAMRERMEWLRAHPDLGHLEPELLELAAQMSLQSRDLAQIYSDAKVARARDFLRQRQQEVDSAQERIRLARNTCDALRGWLTDVETEERKLSEEFKLLERDLKAVLPALGYEIEDAPAAAPANVVALQKPTK